MATLLCSSRGRKPRCCCEVENSCILYWCNLLTLALTTTPVAIVLSSSSTGTRCSCLQRWWHIGATWLPCFGTDHFYQCHRGLVHFLYMTVYYFQLHYRTITLAGVIESMGWEPNGFSVCQKPSHHPISVSSLPHGACSACVRTYAFRELRPKAPIIQLPLLRHSSAQTPSANYDLLHAQRW